MLREASKTARKVIQKTIQKTTLKMNVNEINTIISLSSGTAEVSSRSAVYRHGAGAESHAEI